jgi:hypothetical protein
MFHPALETANTTATAEANLAPPITTLKSSLLLFFSY